MPCVLLTTVPLTQILIIQPGGNLGWTTTQTEAARISMAVDGQGNPQVHRWCIKMNRCTGIANDFPGQYYC